MNNDDAACNFSISPPVGNGNNKKKSLKKNGDDNAGSGQGGTNVAVRRTISKPIADLFPETTILFADIVGFTAWSSQREPPCVFTLLENIYDTFDQIAKKVSYSSSCGMIHVLLFNYRFMKLKCSHNSILFIQRNVFKVETIGKYCTAIRQDTT